MGADASRLYLRQYLINLILLIKDAKTSYSIVINETDSINLLRTNPPKTDDDELRRYKTKMRDHLSMRRTGLMSFFGTCGIISNILWPYIRESKCNMNNHNDGISKLNKRKRERKDHLKDLFPENLFPHLTKHFRNFLMHSDERMDEWSIRTKNRNIAYNTNDDTIIPRKNVSYWINISPRNVVSYYSKEEYKNVDIRMIYCDILKLYPLIPKALDSIMGDRIDWHYEMVKSIIEEE
jgi:hypothetical protein